jgi:hypothetical protein
MLLATHQPIFLPWPAFFFKAMKVDCFVLLDRVQFPRGRGWMTRNRLKNERGEFWLTVPVFRRGRGTQLIEDVAIVYDTGWKAKHLKGVEQSYTHAPYLRDIYPAIAAIYQKEHSRLVSLNIEFIKLLWEKLSVSSRLVLQSEIGVSGRGEALIAGICRKLGATEYLALQAARMHLDSAQLEKKGVAVRFAPYRPPVYPQLWGDFLYNLSTIDLFLNCGPESGKIIMKGYENNSM